MTLQASTRKVLVVDDEQSVRTMLQAVLETEHYEVTTAVSAADARAKISSEDFDVVITDMRMETAVAGYDVVRAARRHSPPPVVIILTAFPITEEEWRDEGADAGFSKPVPVTVLLQTVDKLVRTRVNTTLR